LKVIDATVVIDYLRGHGKAAALIDDLVAAGEAVASEVVRFEILSAVRADELELVEGLCSALAWYPVTEDISRAGADLARRFRASHSGIGMSDYLIAATAMALDAELVTTNVRHFPMFEGLQPPYL
jgi:predicted nucleic acid-binding protein